MAAKPLPTVSAFSWVPPFARGKVRDLRVRLALEEIGQRYQTELYDARSPRAGEYRKWQPFGQVPAYADGTVKIWETGAILLRIAEDSGQLLPADTAQRWHAISWLFAALSSIEPPLNMLVVLGVFNADKPWSADASGVVQPWAEQRLDQLAEALGEGEWLAGDFSIADIAVSTVLILVDEALLAARPRLASYRKRAFARPAYQRALAAQYDDFSEAT